MFQPGPNLWFYRHPTEGRGEPVLVSRRSDDLVMQRVQFQYQFETHYYTTYAISHPEAVEAANLFKVMTVQDCDAHPRVAVRNEHSHAFGVEGVVLHHAFGDTCQIAIRFPGRSDYAVGDVFGAHVWDLQPLGGNWPSYADLNRPPRPQQLSLF